MKWRDARRIAERCRDAYAATTKDRRAKPNSEAIIVCRRKVMKKAHQDNCPGIDRCDEHNGRMRGWRIYYYDEKDE